MKVVQQSLKKLILRVSDNIFGIDYDLSQESFVTMAGWGVALSRDVTAIVSANGFKLMHGFFLLFREMLQVAIRVPVARSYSCCYLVLHCLVIAAFVGGVISSANVWLLPDTQLCKDTKAVNPQHQRCYWLVLYPS